MSPNDHRSGVSRHVAPIGAALLTTPVAANASLFTGDTLDAVANGIAWVAIVIAPIIGIVVFWLLHILPDKIAEKKHHPQTAAIHTLSLLSLFFGGLLWPLAWLWAYTKPVAYKAAYGHDEVDFKTGRPIIRTAASSDSGAAPRAAPAAADRKTEARAPSVSDQLAALETQHEIDRLKRELAAVHRKLASSGTDA